jgi:hypothetical protein
MVESSVMFIENDGDDDSGQVGPDARTDDVVLDTEAEVACPCCGESVVIGLDPGGGTTQEYVEDCQVCCRPWRVRLRYDETGAAEVSVEEAQ